ncbi:MAG: universal stress protein [Burkholderiaceae bacterium]|jgi:nucleotide-binding universal stress UspA family protein|nr:universal stress protein [Burkholderiaceae bacterium]
MAYKTILLHLSASANAVQRIRIAARLAIASQATLIGAAMIGVSTQTFRDARIGEKDPALAGHLRFLSNRAGELVNQFHDEVRTAGVLLYEGRVVDGEAVAGICLQARYSDLVIVGLTDSNEKSPSVPPDFPEAVLLHAGRPVLFIPPSCNKEQVGARVLVAWNASKEARRAVTDAIPLLRGAEVVDVAVFNPETEPDMRDEMPNRDFAVYLSRHGVNVNLLQPQQTRDIGRAVLDTARERGADLLVLGGYGHTRFRELLMGGVTRTVLHESDVPILMSH